jgi:drug/metabolite transporter (DMT)-like permease
MTWQVRLSLALLFVTPAFWTVNYLIARLYVGEIEPHALALLRWSVALCILLPFCVGEIRRAWPLTPQERREFLLMGAFGMWICGAFVYIAGQTTSSVNIGLLYALSPVLISYASAKLLKEPFG